MDIYGALNRAFSEDPIQMGEPRKTSKSQFWGTQQRVFKQLLVSQKVDRAVALAKEAAARGSQVVLSLWGTGESRTADKIKELKKIGKRGKQVMSCRIACDKVRLFETFEGGGIPLVEMIDSAKTTQF